VLRRELSLHRILNIPARFIRMKTTAQVHYTSAADMAAVDDDSVHLVVTSPPYPMIEMWDAMFTAQDAAIGEALDAADGATAFRLMHGQMRPVWDECFRVLTNGGILDFPQFRGQFRCGVVVCSWCAIDVSLGFDC